MSNNDWLKHEEEWQRGFSERKIHYEPCTTVAVNVLRARNIFLGYIDTWLSSSSVRVEITCEESLGQTNFNTKTVKSALIVEWDEFFTFVFSKEEANKAKITIRVFKEDWIKSSVLGVGVLTIKDLDFNNPKLITLHLETGQSEIDVELVKRWRTTPDCRLSLGLSQGEKDYRVKRKVKVMEALQNILGKEKGPKSLQETPTIALAFSGGGYRAMISSCGAMEALVESEIFKSIAYVAGLSGSSWYMASAYHNHAFESLENLVKHHDWLRGRSKRHFMYQGLDAMLLSRCNKYRRFKLEHGQPCTFVDLYGLALGETFLGGESPMETLSSIQSHLKTAELPLPIITCSHVHENLPMSSFCDAVEFTPIEVSLPGYGLNIPSEKCNSGWCNGILQEILPEPPIHYFMGASSSAFAILLSKIDGAGEIEKNLRRYLDSILSQQQEHELEDPFDEEKDKKSKTKPKLQRRTTNFANGEDAWVESLEEEYLKQSSPDYESEEPIGRNFLGRVAKIKNYANSFKCLQKFLFNTELVENVRNASERTRVKMSFSSKSISLCDPGISCNLPTIHLMRPQRKVDILIVVDAGLYRTKTCLDMESFATVQSVISDHGIKFPRISIQKIMKDRFREVYLFEDAKDPDCPIVIWFTLANERFRSLENPPRRPGYPKPNPVDSGEEKFNDFTITPDTPEFATFKLCYTALNFDRLRELMRFNIMSNVELLKSKIETKIEQLKTKK